MGLNPNLIRVDMPRPLFKVPSDMARDRDRELINPNLRRAIQGCLSAELPWPLLIHGQTGSGKTYAALCLIDAYGGWFETAGGLTAMLISAAQGHLQWGGGHSRTAEEVWQDWKRAQIVVLDELGTRKASDFTCDIVRQAIDTRDGKPAVFIANDTLVDLAAAYDDRVASRLAAGTVFELTGDRRLAPAVAGN